MKKSIIVLLLSCPLFVLSQESQNDPDWSTLMKDPSTNFFELSTLHKQVWLNRPIEPGCGFKPFKRWEWLMTTRVKEDGSIMTGTETIALWKQLRDYNANRSLVGNWHQLGPILDEVTTRDNIGGVGRMSALAFHPNDPMIMIAGTPAGGIWRSFDGGNSWNTNTDWLPTLGVSAIVFDPANPTTIYAGTGDRDAYDAPGMGVMKSSDGGENWEFVSDGIENLTVGAIRILPGSGVILIGTNDGIFRSEDAAETWTYVSNNSVDYKDIEVHPSNPQIVYATGAGKFYRSEDAGLNWDWIQEGISSSSRMVIAVTPANPEIVYACTATLYEFKSFYKSIDGGISFTEMSDAPNILGWAADGSSEGGQAWYDFCIDADHENENVVYVGGIRIKKTEDGGVTWLDINPNYVHVDQHELVVSPHDHDLYAANDGGLYHYVDNTDWLDVSTGIINGQIYRLGQSSINPNNTLNGFQDNGTAEFNGAQWQRRGGGDGFECAYDNLDESWRYGSIYYGYLFRTSPDFVNQKFCGFEVNGIDESGAWSSPFVLAHWDQNTMFVGLKNVWRSFNIKDAEVDSIHWKKISNNLGGNNIGDLNVVESCMSNSSILYTAEPNLKLFMTHNANADSVIWVSLSGNLPVFNAAITSIETHPSDTNIVYIGFHNDVYRSADQGQSWELLSGTLPDVSVNTVVIDSTGAPEALYIGTDMGVYYKDGSMIDWQPFNSGMPMSSRVTELEIFYGPTASENRLKAATYGRGLWESDLFGAEDVVFPPVAMLSQVQSSNEVYDDFEVNLTFYRALDEVAMNDLIENDIYIENATVTDITGGPLQFVLQITPDNYGEIVIYAADSIAVDGANIPNYHSDTLKLYFVQAPEQFGFVGPGGVGDMETLTLWLRGDEEMYDSQNNLVTNDSTKVAQWRDLSGHDYIADQSNSNKRPFLRTGENGINGRNAIYFNGVNTSLIADDVVPGRSISAYIIVEADSIEFNDHGWFASAREPNGYLMHPWKNSSQYSADVMDLDEDYTDSPIYYIGDAAAAHIYGFIYHQDDLHQVFTTVFDDNTWPFPGADIGSRDNTTPIEIRLGWDHEERYGLGKIAEHFVFSERLMTSHHRIVSNYLATKYSIDLGPLSLYHHPQQPMEVTGIGRENEFDFHEDAQGRGIVRITTSSINDECYLLVGEDEEGLDFTTGMYPILTNRLSRTWGYTETGSIGAVQVRIEAGEIPAMSNIGIIVFEGDEFLPGADYAFYPLDLMGDYYETYVDFVGSGVFTIGVEPIVSTPDYSMIGVNLFPNPAEEYIQIELAHAGQITWQLQILDETGRIVTDQNIFGNNTRIDLSGLARGLYIVQIQFEGEHSYWSRIIVK